MPGNVRLRKDKASLTKASGVNVSQLRTIDRSRLGDCVGVLSPGRVREILERLALAHGIDRLHSKA
jgi:mRNA-degrading endonuclease toxin of MazEF toxin-antitoxin module